MHRMIRFASLIHVGGTVETVTKIALHTGRSTRAAAVRPDIRRPQRPSGLNGTVVKTVLDSGGSTWRLLNQYLVLLHVAGGLALLAFCMDDIVTGGPSRPMIIPVLGAYMSVSVVFNVVLKDKSPVILLWINGLSDAALLVAAHRLAFINFASLGPDLTVALLVTLASIVYGATGQARLMLTVSAIVTAFFCFTLVSPATGFPVIDGQSVAALLIVAAAAVVGYRIARFVQKKELSAAILTLERLDGMVATQRLRTMSSPESIRG